MMRWCLGVGLALLVLLVAPSAHAQSEVRANALATDGPFDLAGAVDTVIQSGEPAPNAESQATVRLRGPDTGPDLSGASGDTQERVYLLSLSNGGGAGLPAKFKDRIAHGDLKDVALRLNVDGGCTSPNGVLTIHAIRTPAWDPFEVTWDDTDLNDTANATVEVLGPVLGEFPMTVQQQRCGGNVEFALDLTRTRRVLMGELGGFTVRWNGQQPLGIRTLDAGTGRPALILNLTTDAAEITSFQASPRILKPERSVTFAATIDDAQALPANAVSINLTRSDSGLEVANLTATRNTAGAWVTTRSFGDLPEGAYDTTVWVRDADGWISSQRLAAGKGHIVVDKTAPTIEAPALDRTAPGDAVQLDQGNETLLTAQLADAACDAGLDPCLTWSLDWLGITLGNGTVGPDGTLNHTIPLVRPGNDTATLTFTDPLGTANSTSWELTILDTNAPDAVPVEGTFLGPGQHPAIEHGEDAPVALQVLDDLPVDVRLTFQRTNASFDRALPAANATGHIEVDLEDLPEGTYNITLVLEDSEHTVELPWGNVTISPKGAPSVRLPNAGPRARPGVGFTAEVRDLNLDENGVDVAATVNGLGVTADVTRTLVPGGMDLAIGLDGISHGDEIDLRVTARDLQGLTASGRLQVTIDGLAPTLLGPANGTWVAPDGTFTIQAADPGDGSVTARVTGPGGTANGAVPLKVRASAVLPVTGAELHPVALTLRDDAGNTATQDVTLGVDAVAPTIEAGFDAEGLVLTVADTGSGVASVRAAVGINGAILEDVPVDQVGPGTWRPALVGVDLVRGDTVTLTARAQDRVGNIGRIGSTDGPLELEVPDRAPTVRVDRIGPVLGSVGDVLWRADDADGDALEVLYVVTAPDGSTLVREDVNASENRTIRPIDPGRYTVTVQVTAFGQTAEDTTFFYLGKDGRVTTVTNLPTRVSPGEPLTATLTTPSTPRSVHALAIGSDNVSRPATVEMDGTEATLTWTDLPRGDHVLSATILHEPGVVETFEIGTASVDPTAGERLQDLAVPILIVVALLVLALLVWFVATNRGEENNK